MFFASIIVLPILAGVLAGTFSRSRRPAHVLAGVCVSLGIAGAIALGLDDDTTGRLSAVVFGVAAGVVAALLVYLGQLAGRAGTRAIQTRRISD